MNITKKQMEEFLYQECDGVLMEAILDKLDEAGVEWKKEEEALPERLVADQARLSDGGQIWMILVKAPDCGWYFPTAKQAALVCATWNEKLPKLKELERERDELRERIKKAIKYIEIQNGEKGALALVKRATLNFLRGEDGK